MKRLMAACLLASSCLGSVAFSQNNFSSVLNPYNNQLSGQYSWTTSGTIAWQYKFSQFSSGYTQMTIQNNGPDDIKVKDANGFTYDTCGDVKPSGMCTISVLPSDSPGAVNIYSYWSENAAGTIDIEHYSGHR